MGTLIVNRIDFNNVDVVNNIISALKRLVGNESFYYTLNFRPPYYFEVTGGLPPEKGWYMILDLDKKPLYVGRTDDLNARLNTDDRSRDNFGNPKRPSDPQRNFIKKFAELKVFDGLRVCIIQESGLCLELALDSSMLTELDRENIEKLISIFRCYFDYEA